MHRHILLSLSGQQAAQQQCVGIDVSSFLGSKPPIKSYKSTNFVIGINTENVLEARFTGLNARAGDLLTVNFKYVRPAVGGVVDARRVLRI